MRERDPLRKYVQGLSADDGRAVRKCARRYIAVPPQAASDGPTLSRSPGGRAPSASGPAPPSARPRPLPVGRRRAGPTGRLSPPLHPRTAPRGSRVLPATRQTGGMADPQDPRVAVYLDFDNIVMSWYDRVHGRQAYSRDRHRIAEDPTEPEIAERLATATVDHAAA